ncbi:MAG: hypothetical protein BAJALOKI3v1_320039 [Promethearchaeota archaeon]|nr:MAG: hypothetical protein BAJALOKI3v1_320039 [Candidatus Lokiarchaeota archaeon]
MNILPSLEGNNFISVPPVLEEFYKKIYGRNPRNYFKKSRTFGYKPPPSE